MSNPTKQYFKKTANIWKVLFWVVLILVALHLFTDGESTQGILDLFRGEDPGYSAGIPEATNTSSAYMGVTISDAEDASGVYVDAVESGGPAEEAGVEAGDIIVSMNSTQVTCLEDLYAVLADFSPGDTTRMVVKRTLNRVILTITFGERQGDTAQTTDPQETTPSGTESGGGTGSGDEVSGGGGASISAEERLPSVPVELQEHMLLKSRGYGACESFTGKVVMLVVFVDDPQYQWTEGEISQIKSDVDTTVSRISGDAAAYGASLNLSVEYATANSSIALVRSEYDNWVDSALVSMGLPTDAHSTCITLESKYGADEVPIVFFTNQEGRAFASSRSGGTTGREFALLYDSAYALYHEVNHIFGAKDFYSPEDLQAAAEVYFADSIMIDSSNGVMESITAYLIGWTDTLSSEALSFLQSTSYLTKEYLEEQKAINTYSGYVTNHRFDTGSYTGYLVDGFRHGQGTMVWDDGDVYEGEWSNSVREGYGKCTYADGSVYEGYWLDGSRQGYGKMVYQDGDIYDGNWVNGKRDGQGTYTWVSGDRYEGQWSGGSRTGWGTYSWGDGSYYTGDFIDGVRTGQGTMVYTDGAVYEGAWVDNKRSGYGVLRSADGSVYEGYWADNKKNGQGKLTRADGNVYEGGFVDNNYDGYGVYSWASGDRYEGQWSGGNRHGQGTYYWPDGTVYTGDFVQGARTGQGTITWPSGTSYTGGFLDGKLHGYGTYTWPDGSTKTGTWENGNYVG